MRVLALLITLLGTMVGAVGPSDAQQPTPVPRHPGDYCTKHCRHDEIPCGSGCMSTKGKIKKCTAKVTTTCPGKP